MTNSFITVSLLKRVLAIFAIAFTSIIHAENQLIDFRHIGANVGKTGEQVHLHFAEAVHPEDITMVTDTARELTLRFNGVTAGVSTANPIEQPTFVEEVSVVETEGSTVVAFVLHQSAAHKISTTGQHVVVSFHQPNPVANITALPQYKHRINDIEFHKSINGGAELVIDSSTSNIRMTVNKADNALRLQFANAQLAGVIDPMIHVEGLNTPVRSIKITEHGNEVDVLLSGKNDFRHIVRRYNNTVVVEVSPVPPETIADFAEEKSSYTGAPISFDFQNISVRSLLQIIADFTKINILITDSVQGSMSLRLKNIPWDQAFDIILDSQRLIERRIGDVVLVATADEFAGREIEQWVTNNNLSDAAPLYSEVVPLQYSKADEMMLVLRNEVSTILSYRGQMGFDTRTNTLWLKDTAERLAEIRKVIKRIDVPTRQVQIEARVISIDSSDKEEIGVRLGINRPGNNSNLSGTLAGASAQAVGTAVPAISLGDRLNFDLDAQPIDGVEPARIAFGLVDLGDRYLLDLELSALEAEGMTEIISRPHLVTSNMKTARVEAGEEIPFEEQTSSGATSISFKKAVLSLEVTPQITPDERIILDVKVNDDKRNPREFKGVPVIDTQEINTHVLLNDGETVVLGGIYKTTNTQNYDRVPWLSKLPLLGWLFKHEKEFVEREELLIFVTPRIVTQASYSQTGRS